MTANLAPYVAMASAWDDTFKIDLETNQGFKNKDEFHGSGTVGWIRDGKKGRPATSKKRIKRKKRVKKG